MSQNILIFLLYVGGNVHNCIVLIEIYVTKISIWHKIKNTIKRKYLNHGKE